MNTLIEIKNLSVGFHTQGIPNNVVHSISFNIPKGKTVAIVGESGSGKTVTALSILKLLPYPSAFHKTGKIIFNHQNLLSLNEKEIRHIRSKNIISCCSRIRFLKTFFEIHHKVVFSFVRLFYSVYRFLSCLRIKVNVYAKKAFYTIYCTFENQKLLRNICILFV